MGYQALIIPVDPKEAIHRCELDGLDSLQAAVGGYIEAVPFHGDEQITSYVHEDGKLECERNRRATALMGPGLLAGDFIAGPLVLCGFDQDSGENRDLPADFEARWLDRPRFLAAPTITDKDRSIEFTWLLSEQGSQRSVAVLCCAHHAAGVNIFTGRAHPNELYATLRSETHEKLESGLLSRNFRLGDGTVLAREPITRFSVKRLTAFADTSLEALKVLYGDSDERVTRYFRVPSGAAL